MPIYSVAIRAGDQLFVSGMTGFKPGTQDIVEGATGPKTRQTLENIRAAHEAGRPRGDHVQCAARAPMNGLLDRGRAPERWRRDMTDGDPSTHL